MPTRRVVLTDQQSELVDELVREGRYQGEIDSTIVYQIQHDVDIVIDFVHSSRNLAAMVAILGKENKS